MRNKYPRYFVHYDSKKLLANFNVMDSVKTWGVYILKKPRAKTYTFINCGTVRENDNMGDFFNWIQKDAREITEEEAVFLI